MKGSLQAVKDTFRRLGISTDLVVWREGLFKETFRQVLPKKVAFLHIDCDWYESVLESLMTFYPLVAKGGVVVLDDFGHWEGSRKAFFDFCASQRIKPLVERIGNTQLFWIKGKEHNRNHLEYERWGGYVSLQH